MSDPASMRDPVIVRAAQPSDVPDIVRCCHAAIHGVDDDLSPPEEKEIWRSLFTAQSLLDILRLPDGARFVAMADTGVVGFAAIHRDVLRKLYVHPAVQGLGVGGRLLAAVERWAVSRGRAFLHVSSSRSALPFYERHGFTSSPLTETCVIHGIFCHVLEKRLTPVASSTKQSLRAGKVSRQEFPHLARAPIVLVLDSLRHVSNVGGLFRLADAFLLEKVWLCGETAQPGSQKMRRTAKHTDRWVPWEHAPDIFPVVQSYRERGYAIVCAELADNSVAIQDAVIPSPCCLVLGQERRGVDPRVLSVSDGNVALPSLGMGNSLNVALAASILAYEAWRQWNGDSGEAGAPPPDPRRGK